MKETGRQTSVMVKVLKYSVTGALMKGNTIKTRCKGKASTCGLEDRSMKDSGPTILSMALEPGPIKEATLM